MESVLLWVTSWCHTGFSQSVTSVIQQFNDVIQASGNQLHQWYSSSMVSYRLQPISYISDTAVQWCHTGCSQSVTSVIQQFIGVIQAAANQLHRWYSSSMVSYRLQPISYISDTAVHWCHTGCSQSVTSVIQQFNGVIQAAANQLHQWYGSSMVSYRLQPISYISDTAVHWCHTGCSQSVTSVIQQFIGVIQAAANQLHQWYGSSLVSYRLQPISYISDTAVQWCHTGCSQSVTSVIQQFNGVIQASGNQLHQWYSSSMVSYRLQPISYIGDTAVHWCHTGCSQLVI